MNKEQLTLRMKDLIKSGYNEGYVCSICGYFATYEIVISKEWYCNTCFDQWKKSTFATFVHFKNKPLPKPKKKRIYKKSGRYYLSDPNYVPVRNRLLILIEKLPERERRVLEYRFGLATGYLKTLEETGQEFGVTRERIRQIESKGIGFIEKNKALYLELDDIRKQYPNEIKLFHLFESANFYGTIS